MPQTSVTADAIFCAIVHDHPELSRPTQRQSLSKRPEPPAWFKETLENHKGKAVEIGYFAVLAGRFPAPLQERVAIGRWLRDSGRMPRRWGGKKLYDL